MASANLQFKIGSTFMGDGFKQAKEAVNGVKGVMQPALAASNQLASALGSLDSTVGKAGTAISGLLTSFTQGGLVGAAFAAAMVGVNLIIDKFKEKSAEAEKAIKAFNDQLSAAYSAQFENRMKDQVSYIDSMRTDFEALVKAANDYSAAMMGLQKSQASGSVIKLETEKLQAMLEAETEQAKAEAEATYNLRIAKEKAKNTEDEWTVKIQDAHQEIVNSDKRVAVIRQQLAEIEETRENLEKSVVALGENDLDKKKQRQAKIEALNEKEATLLAQINVEQQKREVLLVKEATTLQDAANANEKMTLAVNEANQKILDLEFESAQQLEADRDAYMQELEDTLQQNLANSVENLKAKLDENVENFQKANDELKSAIAGYNNAVRTYNQNYTGNEVTKILQAAANNAVNNRNLFAGHAALLKNAGEIAKQAAKIAGQAAIDKGLVKTVAELKKVQDQAYREAMKQISSKQTSIEGNEALRAARLEKNVKYISEADKKWLENYRLIRAANEKQAVAVEEAKQKVIEARKKQDKLAESVNTIAEALGGDSGVGQKVDAVRDLLASCLKLN